MVAIIQEKPVSVFLKDNTCTASEKTVKELGRRGCRWTSVDRNIVLSFRTIRPAVTAHSSIHFKCQSPWIAFALGTKSQLTPVAPNKPTKIGCKTLTPAEDAMMPVTAGKIDPPICPRTNTRAAGNVSFVYERTERLRKSPYRALKTGCRPGRFWSLLRSPRNLVSNSPNGGIQNSKPTVAKKGPEKKPSRLIATASVMIFGTLWSRRELAEGVGNIVSRHVAYSQKINCKPTHNNA